jgi:hypothetical protein
MICTGQKSGEQMGERIGRIGQMETDFWGLESFRDAGANHL